MMSAGLQQHEGVVIGSSAFKIPSGFTANKHSAHHVGHAGVHTYRTSHQPSMLQCALG